MSGKRGNAVDLGANNSTKALYTVKKLIAASATPASMSIWFKINTLPAGWNSLSLYHAGGGESGIYMTLSGGVTKIGAFRYLMDGAAGYQETSPATFAADTTSWWHAISTYDGTTLTGYLNGESLGGVSAGNGSQSYFPDGFLLGADSDLGSAVPTLVWASVLIDEVGVWDKCLSVNEIADLYNNGMGDSLLGSPLP